MHNINNTKSGRDNRPQRGYDFTKTSRPQVLQIADASTFNFNECVTNISGVCAGAWGGGLAPQTSEHLHCKNVC